MEIFWGSGFFNQMKVSVIIPTTRPQYLPEAIESVKKQTFKDYELLIVEDRFRWGIAKTLNIGTREAKGEYIAILADDDAWLSDDKLAKQVEFLDSHKDYILVGTSSVVIDDKTGREISKFTDENVFPPHSSVMYRKSAGEYDEELPRAVDLDFFLRVSKLGKFGFIPKCYIKYRENSDGRDMIKTRKEDAYWVMKVLKKYNKGYFGATMRYLLFSLLEVVPFTYYLYRKIKYEKV